MDSVRKGSIESSVMSYRALMLLDYVSLAIQHISQARACTVQGVCERRPLSPKLKNDRSKIMVRVLIVRD